MQRIKWLSIHAFWIGTLWTAVWECIMIFFGGDIITAWTKDSSHVFSKCAKDISAVWFYTCVLGMIQYVTAVDLQATMNVGASVILSILVYLLPTPVFSTILYFTKKTDPIRLVYTFVCDDVFSFAVCVFFVIWKLRFIFAKE